MRLICRVKEKLAGDIIQHLMQVYRPHWFGKRMPWNIVLAIKCLSELKNPNSAGNTSKELLKRILELFEMVRWTKDIDEFLAEEIVPAAKLVGKNWHQENEILNWISRTNYGYYESWGGIDNALSDVWAEFAWGLGSEDIYPIIKNKLKSGADIRLLAVLTLGKYQPKNEEIHAILKSSAVNDENEDVRDAAVEALAQGWHDDPQTLLIIRDRAVKDKYDLVRGGAVQALAQGWLDDPQTLPMIRDRAIKDKDGYVRSTVVEVLGPGMA